MSSNIEKNTKKLDSKATEKGEKFQDLQKVQNQILQIQAEREKNLATQRAMSGAETANNQVLAQAAGVMAEGAALGAGTQAVLGRYGYPQTSRSVKRESSRQVVGGNTIINNTVNNVTTNNGGYGGPIQGRPLQFRSQSPDGGVGKFKAWLSNAFARQNEQAAVRDREYRKREWSLSRASNRMAKKLESISRTIGESINPERIGTTLSSQLKALFLLFGFNFLSKNWTRILEKVEKIEEFFTGGIKGGDWSKSGIAQAFTRAFGGRGNESPLVALGKLFWNDKSGDMGILNLFLLKLSHWFEEGAFAAKNIEFPKINLEKPLNSLPDLIKYLGNVISSVFTGGKGFSKVVKGNLVESSKKLQEGINSEGEKASWTNEQSFFNVRKVNDRLGRRELEKLGKIATAKVEYGDISAEKGDVNYLMPYDTDVHGNLTGTVGSTVRQSAAVEGMLKDKENVNTVGIVRGFKNLTKAVQDNKAKYGDKARGVAVKSKSFFTSYGLTDKDIEDLEKSGAIKKRRYKYIIDKKTPKEIEKELNAKRDYTPGNGFARAWINEKIGYSTIGGVLGFVGTSALCLLSGGLALVPIVAGTAAGYAAGKLQESGAVQELLDYSKAKYITDKDLNLEMIRLVPEDHPGTAIYFNDYDGEMSLSPRKKNRSSGGTKNVVEKYTITEQALDKIREKIGLIQRDNKGNVIKDLPFDEVNPEVLSIVGNYASGYQQLSTGEVKDESYDWKTSFKKIGEFDQLVSKNQENYNYELYNGRAVNAVENWKMAVDPVLQKVSDLAGPAIDYVSDKVDQFRGEKNEEENTKKVLDFFTSKGYTPEQAAGMAGVLHFESGGMDPRAENPTEKREAIEENKRTRGGYHNFGRGLAQWSNSRIDEFADWHKKKYGERLPPNEASIDSQLEFIWEEMNKRPALMKALNEASSIKDTVDVFLRGYENGSLNSLASPEAIDRRYENNSYLNMMEQRTPRARGIYEKFFSNGASQSSGASSTSVPVSWDWENMTTSQNPSQSVSSILKIGDQMSSNPINPTSIAKVSGSPSLDSPFGKSSNKDLQILISNSERQVTAIQDMTTTIAEFAAIVAQTGMANAGGSAPTIINNNNVNQTNVSPGLGGNSNTLE